MNGQFFTIHLLLQLELVQLQLDYGHRFLHIDRRPMHRQLNHRGMREPADLQSLRCERDRRASLCRCYFLNRRSLWLFHDFRRDQYVRF